jgi:two-component system chemotaxis sensor kinase CheA
MVSGRGVGMNVVKKTIQELGGSLDLETEKGKGTSFRITLPLTLSIVDSLIVNVSGQTFAVPLPVVNEVIRFQDKELVKMENNELISYREMVLPVIKLSNFFKLGLNGREVYDTLVVGHGNDMVGLAVDRIIGQREIVVRSLSDPFVKVEGISGATELGEGKIVLILDIQSLIKSTIRKKQSGETY